MTGFSLAVYSQVSDGPYRSWIRSLLEVNLSDAQISEVSLDAFVEDFAARFPPSHLHRLLVLGDGRAYWLLKAVGIDSDSMQALERHVLTQFLFATNFFDLDDPSVQPVDYFGLQDHRQCQGRNPFAEFVNA